MYTKESIIGKSAFAKRKLREGREALKHVLNNEEQNIRVKRGHNFTTISDGEVFWFTDDYCMMNTFPKEFVPSEILVGITVLPREEVPHGVVNTAEEYIAVFQKGERQIQSLDELVEYLNRNQPK